MDEETRNGNEGRPHRTIGTEEAVEAWRAGSDLALVVFLPCGERAALEGGRTLDDLTEEEIGDLRTRAVPLTPTETVFRAPDGARWLAQATGPAWAADATPGMLGTRFTRLDGPLERFEVPGAVLPAVPGTDVADLERDLRTLWRAGRRPEPEPS